MDVRVKAGFNSSAVQCKVKMQLQEAGVRWLRVTVSLDLMLSQRVITVDLLCVFALQKVLPHRQASRQTGSHGPFARLYCNYSGVLHSGIMMGWKTSELAGN